MSDAEIDSLHQLPLFRDVPRQALTALLEPSLVQRYPRGTVLFEQGETPDFLHVLLDGTVDLTATGNDGRDSLIEIVKPVDSFILAAALTGTPYLMGARVSQSARILLIPVTHLRQRIVDQPALAITMLASVSAQFRRMVRQVKNLKMRTTTQRVGCYLMTLAAGTPPGEPIRLPHDKQTIAAQLGMTRESLSRALSQLRDLGVESSGDRVMIQDLDRLKKAYSPDRLIDEIETDLTIPTEEQESRGRPAENAP